jgi:hypothetical protein
MDTLAMIRERKRPNADKAALVSTLLGRWGDYAAAMHRRIHELENGIAAQTIYEADHVRTKN